MRVFIEKSRGQGRLKRTALGSQILTVLQQTRCIQEPTPLQHNCLPWIDRNLREYESETCSSWGISRDALIVIPLEFILKERLTYHYACTGSRDQAPGKTSNNSRLNCQAVGILPHCLRVRNHLPGGNEEVERLDGKAGESRLFALGFVYVFLHPSTHIQGNCRYFL